MQQKYGCREKKLGDTILGESSATKKDGLEKK
jgi:hypothetical protein